MALSACRECGAQVSDQAPTCPSCGIEVPILTAHKKLQRAGDNLMGCGCALTILVTLPILLMMCVAL